MSSPVEKFFESIWGYIPAKAGTAYEQLSAIVLHILNSGTVQHDARLRGEFSKTLYQIDALQKSEGIASMAEAKDYSARGGKVGRGDLQKLGGALPDVSEVDSGVFFSATGYTAPARSYASAAIDMIGKPIKLFELRPSIFADEQGFIQSIVLNIHFIIPRPERATWTLVFTERGKQALGSLGVPGGTPTPCKVTIREFYDANGASIANLHEITAKGYADPDPDSGLATGEFTLGGHYLRFESSLVELERLTYVMPYEEEVRIVTISGGATAALTLADANGKVLELINEHALREYMFDAEGNVIAPA